MLVVSVQIDKIHLRHELTGLARLAEMVTLASLTAAVLNIGLDVGRIERFIPYVVWYGRWHSPFVWSMTVITTYFLSSCVYLYLAMRRDLALSASLVPKRAWIYRLLSLGYGDTDRERKAHDRAGSQYRGQHHVAGRLDLLERFPATLRLAGAAMLFAAVVGISVGIFGAWRPGSWADRWR